MKTIYLSGVVGWGITLDKIRGEINPKSKEHIRIIISSPGGSSFKANDIFNFIASYKGKIEMILGSFVASAASYLVMAVPVENRKAFANSSMMIHESRGGLDGRARDFLTMSKVMTGINGMMADAYSKGMGMEKDFITDLMSEDFHFTGGEELLSNGIVSEIIDPKSIEFPEKKDDPYGFDFLFAMNDQLKSVVDSGTAITEMYAAEEKSLSEFKDVGFLEKIVAQIQNFEPAKPVEDKKIKTEGEMDLQSFLKANPEAKAEYEKDLLSAEAKGKKDVMVEGSTALVDSERTRISGILLAAGIKITETVATALDDGSDVGTFATAELARQNKLRTETPAATFGKLANNQTPEDQGKEPVPPTAEQIDASAAKVADKLASDKGGI